MESQTLHMVKHIENLEFLGILENTIWKQVCKHNFLTKPIHTWCSMGNLTQSLFSLNLQTRSNLQRSFSPFRFLLPSFFYFFFHINFLAKPFNSWFKFLLVVLFPFYIYLFSLLNFIFNISKFTRWNIMLKVNVSHYQSKSAFTLDVKLVLNKKSRWHAMLNRW